MTYSEARDLLSRKDADVDMLKFDLALRCLLQDALDLEEILSELVAKYHQVGDIKLDTKSEKFEFASDAILDNITRLASVGYGAFNKSSISLKQLNTMFIRIFSKIDKTLKGLHLQYANDGEIENVWEYASYATTIELKSKLQKLEERIFKNDV